MISPLAIRNANMQTVAQLCPNLHESWVRIRAFIDAKQDQGHITPTFSLSRPWPVRWCWKQPCTYKEPELTPFLMAICLPSMVATQKFPFLRKPSVSCFYCLGVKESVLTHQHIPRTYHYLLLWPLYGGYFLTSGVMHVWNNWHQNPGDVEWQLTWGLDPRTSCVLYVVSRNDYEQSWIVYHTFHLDCRGVLEGSMSFLAELNLERLSWCNFGIFKMRRTLAPVSHLSCPLMSLLIICCWQTSWWVIEVTYCGLILTREYIMNLICNLLCFYIKWRTTKHNEYASECRSSVKVNQS